MSWPYTKDRRVSSAAYLGVVRRVSCFACVDIYAPRSVPSGRAVSEAHHYPPKGAGGARLRDDRTIPLCRMHHDEAQRYVISRDTQERWVERMRSIFLEIATPEELRQFCDDLAASLDPVGAVPF